MAAVTLTLVIVFAGAVYLRGWLHRRSIPVWRACSFFLGLLATWVAVVSPVASLDSHMLTAHMIQHLLLMTIAPPLIWLGEPLTGHAIVNVAFHRTRLLPHDRPPLLVARHSALAVGRTMAAVVDAPVSLPRHLAMRRPFRLARFLRSSRVPHVSLHTAKGRPLSFRRPAVRCSVDVDLRDRCLPGGRNDSLDADPLAETQTSGGRLIRRKD